MLGFDCDLIKNIKLHGSVKQERRHGQKQCTLFDRIGAVIKRSINPVHIANKIMVPVWHYEPKRNLSNLFNPNMNNLTAIDYQLHD